MPPRATTTKELLSTFRQPRATIKSLIIYSHRRQALSPVISFVKELHFHHFHVCFCFLTHSPQANVNCADRWGRTPLQDALTGGHSSCGALLKNKGFICVCIYICIRSVYTYEYKYIYVYIYICIYKCVYIRRCRPQGQGSYMCLYRGIHICMFMCTHIYICEYMFECNVYTCMSTPLPDAIAGGHS